MTAEPLLTVKWHAPQCLRRKAKGLGGCWCHLVPVERRRAVEAEFVEAEARKPR